MEGMIVGTLKVRLYIRESFSLKDKRRVVKSLKDRIRGKFNVSIAEVDELDSLQTALLGVAQVSNDSQFLNSSLSKIVQFIRNSANAEIAHYEIETF